MKLNLSAIMLALGIFSVWFLPWLSPTFFGFLALSLALITFVLKRFSPIGFLLIGLAWGIYHSNQFDRAQIPVSPEGIEASISGVISSIPQHRGISQRFEFQVESFEILDLTSIETPPEKLLLSWYQSENLVNVGERYQFEVKLRRPRGLSNFDQFDYRRWLLGQGIDAMGYIRSAEKIAVRNNWLDRINRLRINLEAKISAYDLLNGELIAALGLGIKEGISSSQWQLFLETGVIHLMVISGLHIGFAGILGFVCFGLLAKPFLALGVLRSDLVFRWLGCLIFAASYALLAGLSLPTLRALLMLSVVVFSRLLYLNWSGWTILSIGLAIIALIQPKSVLQDSFWLSFGAVCVLLVSLSGRPKQNFFIGLVYAQCALLIGFGGLLLFLGKPVYLGGLLANLIAVPITGFVIVPSILLGLAISPILPELSANLMQISDWFLGLLLQYLGAVSQINLPELPPPDISSFSLVLIVLSGLLFISFPSARLRLLLAFVVMPLAIGFHSKSPDISVLAFDVGQGTSVLIEQPGYRLLYDTGPAFSAQFNAGADIVVPELLRKSNQLDALIISHDDSDHSGGFEPVVDALQVDQLFVGGVEHYRAGSNLNAQFCHSEIEWRIDEVNYQFLHPQKGYRPVTDNNQSCILLIEFANKKILLSGDIDSSVEGQLLNNYPQLADLDLLLVPHHGSKTSSSEGFVATMKPEFALVSAGYGNSFGHPAKEVLERYRRHSSEILSTAEQGAIRFAWHEPDSEMYWQSSRAKNIFWWQE